MSKKYSDTEKSTPVLSSILLEGLFAEMISQIKQSLDCCQPDVRVLTGLTAEENLVVVSQVTRGEVELVIDITKNHSMASLNKKHGPFVKRLRAFYNDIKDMEIEREDPESLEAFLRTLTTWMQDAHLLLMEDTPKQVRQYLSEKSGYDKTPKEPSFHVLPGGDRGSDEESSEGDGASGQENAEGEPGSNERGSDGSNSGGMGKRSQRRKPRRKARLKLANDPSLEDEGELGEES